MMSLEPSEKYNDTVFQAESKRFCDEGVLAGKIYDKFYIIKLIYCIKK